MDISKPSGYVPGFPNGMNLRELGGIEARDGRRVRHGFFFQGPALSNLTAEQCAAVQPSPQWAP